MAATLLAKGYKLAPARYADDDEPTQPITLRAPIEAPKRRAPEPRWGLSLTLIALDALVLTVGALTIYRLWFG